MSELKRNWWVKPIIIFSFVIFFFFFYTLPNGRRNIVRIIHHITAIFPLPILYHKRRRRFVQSYNLVRFFLRVDAQIPRIIIGPRDFKKKIDEKLKFDYICVCGRCLILLYMRVMYVYYLCIKRHTYHVSKISKVLLIHQGILWFDWEAKKYFSFLKVS